MMTTIVTCFFRLKMTDNLCLCQSESWMKSAPQKSQSKEFDILINIYMFSAVFTT